MTTAEQFREECERSGDVFSVPDRKVTRMRFCRCPEWLPMDSAPKDSDRIYVRHGHGDEPKKVTIAQWNNQDVWGTGYFDWHDDSGKWLDPDAWMPLPTP
jgi:hypothetical protein